MKPRPRQTVMFLCTGNYYRSRFAEILFNSLAEKMDLPWQASSRGLALERGTNNVGPIAVTTRETLLARGVPSGDAFTRMPMSVTNEDFQNAVRVVALKQSEHLPLMQDRFPLWADKIEYWDIDDVPGVLDQVEKEVMSFVARILGGGQPEPPSPEPKKPVKKVMTVKVGRETAGRRGKGVVTIFDVPLDENGLRELAGLLKQRCGTGGTVKDGRIEIQGDQRERVVAELERLGYQVKRVGG